MFTNAIPAYVSQILKTLNDAGFEAYLVGGCVRDLFLERIPKDWDVTTNALPEQIQALFPHTVYENTFGTVGVVCDDFAPSTGQERAGGEVEEKPPRLSATPPKEENHAPIVEITPYRTEMSYSDKRHPDGVSFSNVLEDDLKRRDFTVNALAFNIQNEEVVDLYKGQNDLKDKVLRTVGNPDDRFTEDALRILRAIRFSVELGFILSTETLESIVTNAHLINDISWERKRDEFVKMIMSPEPLVAIGLLEKTGLLQHLIPELREGIGCEQKGAHIYDVFEHMLHALGHATQKNQPLEIRLSALFHDIGKPRTRRYDKTKDKYTFYGHEVIGARMVVKIMERFHFSRETSELVTKLVRYHMFFSDTEVITLSPVRRMIQNVGVEHIWELMQVRECDRVGMRKAEAPYRLRKYHAMIEEALRDPISVSALKIDGNYLMKEMNMKPGRRMGWILLALLEDVLEDPTKNTVEILTERVKELDTLGDVELKKIGEQAKEQKDELNEEEIKKLHMKHGVGGKR